MPAVAAGAVLAGLTSGLTVSAGVISFSLTMGGFLAAAGSSLLLGGAQMLLSSGAKKAKGLNSARESSTQSVRQAVTTHKLVYGHKRISGPITFMSSTQDNLYLHLIVVLAAHKLEEIGEVWLGDESIPDDFLDANGNVIAGKYEGYARIRKVLGDPNQSADALLAAEVPEWSSEGRLRGRAYLYVRLKYSQDKFSGIPNISALVKGFRVFDPRDNNYRFTSNAALIARAYLADSTYGFEAEGSIDEASVIAAANICDEIVDTQLQSVTAESVDAGLDVIELDCETLPFVLGDRVDLTATGAVPTGLSTGTNYYAIPYQHKRQSGNWSGNKPRVRLASSLSNAMAGVWVDITSGGSGTITVRKTGEPRFHAAALVDSGKTLGDNLTELLSGFGGRAVYAGGRWRLLAAAYQVPTITLTEKDMTGPIQVKTKISRSERFNQINGVYSSPLNDWQTADYPPLKDAAAIARDQQEIPRNYDLPVTNRPYTAQRIAKIELKKAVQEFVVQVPCNLSALRLQGGDTVMLSNTLLGWSSKVFEVTDFKFTLGGNGGEPVLGIDLSLRETASAIYDWNSSEESLIDEAPNTNLPNAYAVQAVSGLRFDSIPNATRDGDVTYSMVISWDEHADAFVREGGSFAIQYKKSSDADYLPSFRVDGAMTTSSFAQASIGVSYDVRVMAINNMGMRSAWQVLSDVVAGSSGGVTETEDWGLSTDTVTGSEDYALSTDSVTESEDYGSSS